MASLQHHQGSSRIFFLARDSDDEKTKYINSFKETMISAVSMTVMGEGTIIYRTGEKSLSEEITIELRHQ